MKRVLSLFTVTMLFSVAAFGQSNTATATQNGGNNNAQLSQAGVSNSANATTFGQDNRLSINSAGDFNNATIGQGSATTLLTQNEATINQIGSTNNATIDVVTAGQWSGWKPDNSTHLITQTGSNNNAETIVSAKWSNTEILQTGDFNTASQGRVQKAERSLTLLISQLGSEGASGAFSGGANQALGLNVEGNYARQTVRGDNLGRGEIQQDGYGNYANQFIRVGVSKISQTGNSNWASVDQSSSKFGNATVSQIGGDENIVDLQQTGDNSEAIIMQDGSFNGLFGLDGRGTTAQSLDQSSLRLNQIGLSNSLFLNQSNAASAVVNQTGTTNTATITQN